MRACGIAAAERESAAQVVARPWLHDVVVVVVVVVVALCEEQQTSAASPTSGSV